MKNLKRLLMPFFFSAALCIWFVNAQAIEVRIRIPDDSSLHLYSPDQSTTLVSFSGEVVLQGKLLLLSYVHSIDEDAEWRVSLRFLPDLHVRNKLPHVRYAGEPDELRGEPWIDLDYFQEEQKFRTIEAIFGAEMAAKAGKEVFEVGKQGYLRLKSYRTNVECDHRYYYAEVVSFNTAWDIPASQVREQVRQMRGCG